MYPDGIAWDYTGRFDPKISPLYQYIKRFDNQSAPSGAGYRNWLEPLWPG